MTSFFVVPVCNTSLGKEGFSFRNYPFVVAIAGIIFYGRTWDRKSNSIESREEMKEYFDSRMVEKDWIVVAQLTDTKIKEKPFTDDYSKNKHRDFKLDAGRNYRKIGGKELWLVHIGMRIEVI